MRRFLGSAWFAFLTVDVFALATVAMFAVLTPDGADVGSTEITNIFKIAGWVAGPVLALLSLLLIFVLNGIRRLAKIRRTFWLHPVVIILGLLPWFLFGWQLTMNEPRYTPIAKAVIDFIGKEMFVGSFVAILFVIILSIPGFFSKKA